MRSMDDTVGDCTKAPHESMEIRHEGLKTPPVIKAVLGQNGTDPKVDLHKGEIMSINLLEIDPSQRNEVRAAGGESFIAVMIGYVKLGGVYAPLSADAAEVFADQLKAAAADLRKSQTD